MTAEEGLRRGARRAAEEAPARAGSGVVDAATVRVNEGPVRGAGGGARFLRRRVLFGPLFSVIHEDEGA